MAKLGKAGLGAAFDAAAVRPLNRRGPSLKEETEDKHGIREIHHPVVVPVEERLVASILHRRALARQGLGATTKEVQKMIEKKAGKLGSVEKVLPGLLDKLFGK